MESKAAKEDKGIQPDSTPKIIYLTDEAREQRIVKCPYCGAEVSTDDKKCNHCGRQIEILTGSAEKNSQDRPANFDSLGYIKSALASKYQVLEEVAKTDTSTVFRAIHLQLRREVALKVLLKNITKDRDFTDRFHRRARAIDKLSQNNIITILDEGVETGVHYMAMEFLKGVDLQRKISEDGPLSPEELINILLPAISGLGHAHSNGILHGNIKCASIFLHDDGRIILLGFGIPHLTKGNLLSFKRDANSIEYLSPEEASGKSVDGRSDIYSLGVVMYYSLTGRFPYTGLDAGATITSIVSQQYVPINKLRPVPQWLERIVDKCLQRDISKRVQSCAELMGLLNVRPAAQPTQTGTARQPSRDIKPTEPEKEKYSEARNRTVETSKPIISKDVPPSRVKGKSFTEEDVRAVERPVEDESFVEEPTVEFSVSEEVPPQVVKDVQSSPSPRGVKEPVRVETRIEKKVEKKGKSKVFVWVLFFVIIGIGGAAVTLTIMNRKPVVNESTVPASEPNQAQTTNEQSNSQVVNQENGGNSAQPANQNTQAVPSSTTEQGTASSDNNIQTQEQSVSKTEVVPPPEKNTPAPRKTVAKSVSGSIKKTPVAPVNNPQEESKVTNTPPPPVVTLVTVPDLTGTQLNVAKSILSLNGLKLGAVTTIPDPRNDGMVVRQVPKPGTQLNKGSTVNLIMGSK